MKCVARLLGSMVAGLRLIVGLRLMVGLMLMPMLMAQPSLAQGIVWKNNRESQDARKRESLPGLDTRTPDMRSVEVRTETKNNREFRAANIRDLTTAILSETMQAHLGYPVSLFVDSPSDTTEAGPTDEAETRPYPNSVAKAEHVPDQFYIDPTALQLSPPLPFFPRLAQGLAVGVSAGLASAALIVMTTSVMGRAAKLAKGSKLLSKARLGKTASPTASTVNMEALLSLEPGAFKSLLSNLVPAGAAFGVLHALGDGLAWWNTDVVQVMSYAVQQNNQLYRGHCVVFMNINTYTIDYEVGRCTEQHEGLFLPLPSADGLLRSPDSSLEFIDDYYEHNIMLHRGTLAIK